MNDLEKLARAVHEAPEGYISGHVHSAHKKPVWHKYNHLTIEDLHDVRAYPISEILAERDRLTGKPTEWVNDWTRFKFQSGVGIWYESKVKPIFCEDGFNVNGLFAQVGEGEVIGDFRDTLEERVMENTGHCSGWTTEKCEDCTCVKSAPKQERSAPEWDGEGLPHEGECECFAKGYADWVNCYIFAVRGDEFWAHIGGNSTSNIYPISEYQFRPIRTERDKCIEAMVNLMSEVMVKDPRDLDKAMAEALYDSNLFDISLREGE